MKKGKSKLKGLKSNLIIGVIAFVLVVSGGIASVVGIVKAGSESKIGQLIELAKVVNTENKDVIMSGMDFLFGEDGLLGGGTRYPNGISADTTSPLIGEVRGTTFTVTDTLNVTGTVDVGILTQSGNVRSIATTTAKTLRESDLLNYTVIEIQLNDSDETFTLPASTTLIDFLPEAGDMRQTIISNISTNSRDIILSAGTGSLLFQGSTTTVDYKIGPGYSATLDWIRNVDTDVKALMTVFTN